MLANIVEKWCLRGWYKNQKIPDLCGGAEQLPSYYRNTAIVCLNFTQEGPKWLIAVLLETGPI
ncbi:hypothetical protein [Endozoicomonas sp. SCSIO W0465]|uniref:hypothetical protein n=1 Tax=Endozoicomonas sp. SCSIO W0465 TaxID=2918516 RepID=UPI0020765B8C|nr:hypothetical protein [Endozoicomonas sp. SCSIO W0465]USE37085.1 hypothetical protein MJO57_02310 [Endozoicomonas sp. SCSIO W0465]